MVLRESSYEAGFIRWILGEIVAASWDSHALIIDLAIHSSMPLVAWNSEDPVLLITAFLVRVALKPGDSSLHIQTVTAFLDHFIMVHTGCLP